MSVHGLYLVPWTCLFISVKVKRSSKTCFDCTFHIDVFIDFIYIYQKVYKGSFNNLKKWLKGYFSILKKQIKLYLMFKCRTVCLTLKIPYSCILKINPKYLDFNIRVVLSSPPDVFRRNSRNQNTKNVI